MPRNPTRALHLFGASLIFVLSASPADAQFRSPQVPVTGSALQAFMNSQGQSVDVTTQQRLVAYWSGLYLTRPSSHFFVRSFGDGVDALAVYDANDPARTLWTIHPAAILPGWFTEVGFRDDPVRMVVNLYDNVGSFQGSTTYLGLGYTGFGFATTGPGGVFYAFDELNPGQRAHILALQATAQYGTWLCLESQAAASGGDFDFADAMFLLENINVTPLHRTTWGAIKQRFR